MASWLAEIAVADVQQVVGILPPAVIGELLAKVAAALPPPQAPADTGGTPPDGSPPSPPPAPAS